MTPPSLESRFANLAKANEIRLARKELKLELQEGARTLAEVLRADEDFIQTMKVAELLKAVPCVGPVKAQRALNACQISPTASLEVITLARREQLIAYLRHFKSVPVEAKVEAELYGGKGGYR